MRLLISIFFLLFVFPFQQVLANQIPLGLNSKHGIFVQEFWQESNPVLCLTNRSNHDEVVLVSRWRSSQVLADPVLQLPLGAGSTHCHSVGGLQGKQLLEFTLASGSRLGLLRIQRPKLAEEQHAAFSSFKGPNGTCNSSNTWVQQSGLWFKSGEQAHVRLLSIGSDVLIELPVETSLDLPQLHIKSIMSDTLSVDNDNHKFSINSNLQVLSPIVQQAQIELDIPEVRKPTLFIVSGRQRTPNNGWQCLIRGVMVKP